jgi:hypothetical protein
VEGTHRQLGTGFTDRLSGNDTDSFTDVDDVTGCKVTAVTLGTDAHAGVTGQHRADTSHLDTSLVHSLSNGFVDQRTAFGDNFIGVGIFDLRDQNPTQSPVTQRLLDVRAFTQWRHGDTVGGTAIGFRDSCILSHVHETTGQVT